MVATDAPRQDIIERSLQRIDECFHEIQNNTNVLRREIRLLQSNATRYQIASSSADAIEEN